ncbi:hypothetical protein GCM10010218_63740 [Streptomyces mashuensis]|uniref:Phosphatidic acid phosphatase type 2/haloperoxidase domain-containing protein n=1 Tax=Streptomyces mashuensis TaxID=33904 RepID=A0A919B9U9_9ACTN|nr:phosphatase PAP2 family protein [Streptomyces mashuensis]GHF73803.1 hypothetical protein GCM10010218_63740 [Streptomyces mashuensis]
MSETPRPQGTADDAVPVPPQCRSGRAFAHIPGAPGSGRLHRSGGRPSHTPREARHTGRNGGPGTLPPVPGPPAFLLLPLLCFAFLAWQVVTHGPLRALDERLGHAVAAWSALPRGVAGALADLGSTTVALPVLAAAAAWSWWRARRRGTPRPWRPALAAALAMAVVPALVVPLKLLVARPGPPAMAGGPHDGFFPSGHAATAAVAYGAVLLLSRWRRRWPALAAYGVLNGAVALGLVRCGYHWPLDVLGSWLLCGALLGCLARLTRPAGR